LGEASASCWRLSAAASFEMQAAVGACETNSGSSSSPSVSRTIVWPPPLGATPSVPAAR
jgi:hypothetical protein